MIEKTSLSALLKHYRLASSLSQEALVAHAGLSVYAISNLERGIHRTPHSETFNLLSNALSLSSDKRALLLITARFKLDAPIEAPPAFPSPGLPFPSTALIGREQENPVNAISRNTAGGFVLTRHPGCSHVHPDIHKPFWWLSRKNKSMSQFELKERSYPMEITFPSTFLWGTATAAHQVEGGNVYNDNWVLEHVPGSPYVESSGDACDQYHRYREDIALLADLGFTLYRFSLEWSRIEPEEGEFSLAQLDHYRRMLATCHEHEITPMVTFHHFTSPRWLAASGGWETPETPEKFARFCERAMAHLGDLIPLACTLNEVNIGPLITAIVGDSMRSARTQPWFEAAARHVGSDASRFTPFLYADVQRGRETILAAHRRAVEAIKGGPGRCEVGLTLAMQDIQAGPGGEEMAARMRRELLDVYLEGTRGDDFIGVQTYSRQRYGPDGPLGPEEGVELTQMKYEFWPEALEATIRYASKVTGLPVIVTENGIATDNDTRRIAYVERALRGVDACLREGIDVRGYIYWSTLDNFEWIAGYRPTFGLIAVDRWTQERTVKPSAHWLGSVARANGF